MQESTPQPSRSNRSSIEQSPAVQRSVSGEQETLYRTPPTQPTKEPVQPKSKSDKRTRLEGARTSRRSRIQGGGHANAGDTDESEDQGFGTGNITYRIGGMTKYSMLTLAVLFDLLPLLVVIAIIPVAIMLGGGGGGGSACEQAKVADSIVNVFYHGVKCGFQSGGAVILAGMAGLTVVILLGGYIYALMSFLTPLLAALIFFGWFSALGVPYFSSKNGRFGAMFFSYLIEVFPLTSWLPGIWFSTWKQVQIARMEDEMRQYTAAS